MEATLAIPTFLLVILNLLGGLVSGIALAIQGEWSLLLGGIGWAIAGPFIISLAMAPSFIFYPLVGSAAERGHNTLAVIAGIPAMLWTYLIITATCLFVFLNIASAGNAGFFHLIWAYSTATAPWSYMARQEAANGNDNSSVLNFFIQLGTVSMMVAAWLDPYDISFQRLAAWFLPFMALGFLTQLFVAYADSGRSRGY
jgi:hypothetical protein